MTTGYKFQRVAQLRFEGKLTIMAVHIIITIIFIGKTDAEAPILLPPDVNSRFIRKASDAGKD